MIINYTEAEKAEIEAFEEKYAKLIRECEEEISRLQDGKVDREAAKRIYASTLKEPVELRPDPIDFRADGDPIYDADEWKAYKNTPQYIAYFQSIQSTNKKISELFVDFENRQSDEWKKARNRLKQLDEELIQTRESFLSKCEQRQFNELCGDPGKIIDDAKSQITQIIKNRYNEALRAQEDKEVFSSRYLRVDGKKLFIDIDEMMQDSTNVLRLHYAFFENDQEATKKLRASIFEAIEDSPYTGNKGILGGLVNDPKQAHRTYRTRAKAKEHGIITEMPKFFGIPTLNGYESSINFYEDDTTKAHLMAPLNQEAALRFDDGNIFIESSNGKLREISEMELTNLITKERIDYIDLRTLMVFYNIILDDFKKSGFKKLKEVHTIHIPQLFSYLGVDPRINSKNIARVKHTVESYHNMVGVYYTEDGKKNRYPVLNFEGDSEELNTISFSSPYLNYVIKAIYRDAIRRNKKGEIDKQSNGQPLLLPNHTYSIKPELYKEKGQLAIKNVEIIVVGIAKAGNHGGYHTAARTIVEKNTQLAFKLEKDPQHATQLLKRVFSKTWELLRTKTTLEEDYIDIKLPDPNDPQVIPTAKNLDEVIIDIPHKGKKKEK